MLLQNNMRVTISLGFGFNNADLEATWNDMGTENGQNDEHFQLCLTQALQGSYICSLRILED